VKVRELITLIEADGWSRFERKGVIVSTVIQQNRER
jgi:predicted RNA binding protein YcfA (HicA-like mRNA interferase family)